MAAAGARTECSGVRGARAGGRCCRGDGRCCQSVARRRHESFPSAHQHHATHDNTQRSMLQQMSSQSVQIGEVTAVAPPITDVNCVDVSSEASSSDITEELELPDCKIKRNYDCKKCDYHTQNPRAYLLHLRAVHSRVFTIYECSHCLYASAHNYQLVRHLKTVHGESTSAVKMDTEAVVVENSTDKIERMEDLLEEIEECDDNQVDTGDGHEDITETFDDVSNDVRAVDKSKGKGKFFSCDKCHYVTHIKARYTKHVKYHSMPMIKCTICEFRTPYKWNLDRHMKNHGGTGNFVCSKCSFTADIKQSLTVHEMNHHTPPIGLWIASGRRRNRVGASDLAFVEATLPKEEEGSGDSRSSHSDMMGLQNAEKDIVSCNSDSNDATSAQGTMNGQDTQTQESFGQHSPHSGNEESKSQKQSKKARPIPQLIPLNASTPNKGTGEPPMKKFKDSTGTEIHKFENSTDDTSSTSNSIPPKDSTVRKKNESFFDRLKERLLTETGEEGSLKCKNCGFESKCLSEHSVHEKNCSIQPNRIMMSTAHQSMGSTRCQHCRHRCKSSADLYLHMQTCGKKERSDSMKDKVDNASEASTSTVKLEKESEPHPMENVVFVWNNIGQNENKFDRPLDININDDSTLPDHSRNYDIEAVDESESMNLSPNSLSIGKNVYKCPDCKFWAATASRFHVHIVGHLNKKPFECSLCKYKSNWRWDITKHIKLKSARDPEHNDAKVLMTDETGRRNYSKYNKFLAVAVVNENGENEFHYIDPNTEVDATMEVDESCNEAGDVNSSYEMQPLNLQTQTSDLKYDSNDNGNIDGKKPKKTLWKCKRCNYKDSSKEALLEHVKMHSRGEGVSDDAPKKAESTPDPADLAYRCGHCNQLSNWKHVIQRHCRLKHDGVIKVITTVKPKPEAVPVQTSDVYSDHCNKCPFKTNDKKQLMDHLQQHQPSAQSIFKCYFCPYFVKDEQDLIQHLLLHGITDPEDYIAKAMGCKSPLPDQIIQETSSSGITKRHKCTECPYETNSKSQYMYHEQFHRLPADTPYKCPECNYSVSKRHLLHQHLRVHGINTKKNESEAELEASTSFLYKSELKHEDIEDIPYVWVSARNEFHKMFKCRYCSYVNSQKCKIPNHEKIHCLVFENSEVIIYKCLECKFTCDNAGRLAEHSKRHGLLYGRIYGVVDENIPDEDQIAKLRKVIEQEKTVVTEETIKEENASDEQIETKILYFCQKCPARYFTESEIKVHEKFHDLTLTYKCKHCEFSVAEESELAAHLSVHSDEYHIRTNMLKFVHNSHSLYKEPRLEINHDGDASEIIWVISTAIQTDTEQHYNKKTPETKHTPKQYFCKECPAKFFKSSALTYHMGLHGGEGEHKCKKCSYAVKNVGNLAKHELLHENENKPSCEYESGDDVDYKNIPLSGTDLFQRKTEAQKRVLTDKDKLVKPNDHFPPVLQADPQFGYLMHGNPEFIYPTYLKNGRQKEKRYKCHKCPSAFEKREQYKIHLSLHGSKQRYKCELCDYSVKYYANYVQHMRKHQMNDEAQAERKKGSNFTETESQENKQEEGPDNIKLAIKTMPRGIPKSDFQQFSVRDQQTLRLLQRRRSMVNGGKDTNTAEPSPTKERRLHMCLLCPYTNQRQDALTNHYRRHDETDVLSSGNHKCSFCDLVVVQSHFLREHLKTHFNYPKTLTPECFVANEDVSFTITKIDEESEPIDLKLELKSKILPCNDEKIYVKMKTGEIVVDKYV